MARITLCSNNHKKFDETSSLISDIYKKSKLALIIPGFSDMDKSILKAVGEKFSESIILSKETSLNQLKKADCIIICAGFPDKQLEFLKKNSFDKFLKNFEKDIVTFSAGSLILGKNCIITPDDDYPELKEIPGLGLFDFSVEVHYTPECDKILIELSKKGKICAIPEDSVLFVNQSLQKHGSIYVFENGQKSKW